MTQDNYSVPGFPPWGGGGEQTAGQSAEIGAGEVTGGCRGGMRVELYKAQRYAKLRKHHQELGVPWSDPTFPANDSSIGLVAGRELRGVEWRRVSALCASPRLVVHGLARQHVVQVNSPG